MNYKTLFQVILIIIAFVLSLFFYVEYFHKNGSLKKTQTKNITPVDKQDLSSGNTVKEILYESFDNNGNKYIIKSDFGTFNDEKKEEILMTNVKATISFNNGTVMNLKSERAKYNTVNNDTYFFNSVELKYLSHLINSNNIDILFEMNRLEAYNDLVYRNPDIKLSADKIEFDLLSKNTKIFMFDDSKVKIISN
tara:strand:- start:22 stop:603 length:582 start_codon:yes stop_codon:yes gene_type:complete